MRRPCAKIRLLSTLLLTAVLLVGTRSRPAEGAMRGGGFTDPFMYCAAVGTVDQPDARWAGPKVPEAVVEGLIQAAGMPENAPRDLLARTSYWRCMDGHVYACFVGANLPCAVKADTRRTPTPAMWLYCDQNPDADNIPAYVTGRETVYQWRCIRNQPTVVRQVAKPDRRGFIKNIWYRIDPPEGKR